MKNSTHYTLEDVSKYNTSHRERLKNNSVSYNSEQVVSELSKIIELKQEKNHTSDSDKNPKLKEIFEIVDSVQLDEI